MIRYIAEWSSTGNQEVHGYKLRAGMIANP